MEIWQSANMLDCRMRYKDVIGFRSGLGDSSNARVRVLLITVFELFGTPAVEKNLDLADANQAAGGLIRLPVVDVVKLDINLCFVAHLH